MTNLVQITVDADTLAAALSKYFVPAGTATTPPVTTTPPVVTTPPVSTANGGITSGVYVKGSFLWAGDWNDTATKMNYAYASAGVNGDEAVIQMPASEEWALWLPYPHSNSAGPASNGVNFPLAGLTHFTAALKPSVAGGLMTMQLYTADGATDDIAVGNIVTLTQAKYGPAPVAGQWGVYTVPLTDFITPVPGWIYKFNFQQQGVTPQEWLIDQVGFF